MVKILIVLFLMYPWDCEDVMDLFGKLLTMRINLFWSLLSLANPGGLLGPCRSGLIPFKGVEFT